MKCVSSEHLKSNFFVGSFMGESTLDYLKYWSHWQNEYTWHENKYAFKFPNSTIYFQGLLPACEYDIQCNGVVSKMHFPVWLN